MAYDERDEELTFSKKMNAFLEKNRKIVLGVFGALLLAIIAFVVVEVVLSTTSTKNLAAVDAISFELTDGSGSLEEAELTARRDSVLEKLVPYTKKGGVAGVRANMLAAEIEYQKKNYEEALGYWENAANKGKKAYTASLAYYNQGVCLEMLNRLDEAAEVYELASLDEEFLLRSHALFSYGRVLEATGKYAEAVKAYQELNDEYPDESWTNLAKTRILELKIEGKVE
jgi:tetratricopeptide (TPR) repeat protein